jgi:hypothetical protein
MTTNTDKICNCRRSKLINEETFTTGCIKCIGADNTEDLGYFIEYSMKPQLEKIIDYLIIGK